ncbi:MAG: DUF951 domain-containing protein [SAR202 cluster bacterium]|nr:DUF951 domain-containing protein [SAR202 cluster bacterium]
MAPLIEIGSTVRLKKPHPCGNYDWTVTRLGTDIGLLCVNCKRRIMVSRSQLSRRLKEVVSNSETYLTC